MKETRVEKRTILTLKEKSQYALAFGIVALMLYVVGFPVFILFFFGVLAFFLWKAFSAESRNDTRQIFEFYLSANEIIRDDDRRWYGFEIQESIARGEGILKEMSAPPPLVHFALGALYQKIGDHGSAAKHLTYVVEEAGADESAIVFPTKELREYVRILRKIERAPLEAPLTSSAVRSLERARKSRAKEMLDLSRMGTPGQLDSESDVLDPTPENIEIAGLKPGHAEAERGVTYRFSDFTKSKKVKKGNANKPPADRKTISEVLHDIYDKNSQ